MKVKHLVLLISSLLLLSLTSCSKDVQQDLVTERNISVKLTMPENISIDGIKGSMAYYWKNDLTFQAIVSQEGKASKSFHLSPNSIPAEGKTVNFNIELKSSDFDLNGTVEISGVVTVGKEAKIPVGVGSIFIPSGYGDILPYDILKSLNQPLLIEKSEFSLKDHDNELSVTLKPQGQLIFLQLHDESKKRLQPKTITLNSDEKLFFDEEGVYDVALGEFKSNLNSSSITLDFPQDNRTSPKLTSSYIVWIPSNKINSVGLSIRSTDSGGVEVVNTSPSQLNLSGPLPLIYVSISDAGGNIGNEPIVEEADTSEGGDPLFTMNDIQFWVGDGEKRAALVIEWHDGKEPDALVWGYRWDGDKTGYDMAKAIAAADSRLSVLMGKAFGGLDVVGGIGYQFKVTDPRAYIMLDGEKLANDGHGITHVDSAKEFDNYTFSESKGHWKNGWYKNGYWVYYTKDNRLDSWSYSQVVYSLRNLEDGCWDGWSFQDGMESTTGRPHGNKFTPAILPTQEITLNNNNNNKTFH